MSPLFLRLTSLTALAVAVPVTLPSCVTTTRVASGLNIPVHATAPAGDANRLFIVEKDGLLKTLDLNTSQIATFLDIRNRVFSNGEEGLLGLAFHPQFATNRRFYVYHTVKYIQAVDRALILEEYTANAQLTSADPATARTVLRISDPQDNHNGGWITFGPDGFLYVSIGDGGNGNDDGPGHSEGTGNAQDITDNLLGKMLRINPDPAIDDFPADPNKNYGIPAGNPFIGVIGDDEIWSYGLRNPWRCSFDRQTGDMWIGDVGQNQREEIDFLPAGNPGGQNFGWRLREGTIQTPTVGGPPPAGNVEPVYDYGHGAGAFQGNSVTGGYVYRGPIVSLRGTYFFADYVSRKIWSFKRSGTTITDLTDWTTKLQPSVGSIGGLSSFGEDANGNLYLVDYDGEIYQVVEKSLFSGMASNVAATITQWWRAIAG